ncbi:MAG: FAD:protein FMN transferase [Oscillospiraceae bacterium]|jgi:thiamine biosynthesis lipoprotein|nr:FAD:protein FMN transferase [Oscillospiraceae bacterium]
MNSVIGVFKKIKEKAKNYNSKNYVPWLFLLIIVIAAIVGIFIAMEQNNKSYVHSSIMFGTQARQTLFGEKSNSTATKVQSAITELEETISYEIDGSDIARLNFNAGEKWIKPKEETIIILRKAVDVAKHSGRVYDPTSSNLHKLWGIDSGKVQEPERKELDDLLKTVDYRNILIDENDRVKLENSETTVSLSSVAKGAACEKAVEIYKNSRINHGFISIGNVLGFYGHKPDGTPWQITIEDFINHLESNPVASLKLERDFVATFGSNNEKVEYNNRIINKIINAKTGMIPENNISSVTIIHSDGVIACALAQVCAVLGPEKSVEILKYYGAESVFIDSEKKLIITPNLEHNIVILNPEYKIKLIDVS